MKDGMATTCVQCGHETDPGEPCFRCLMRVALEPEPDVPPKIRGLEILEPLGRGGMGRVYKARQAELGRTVAVKILPPELAESPDFMERFRREAQALAAADHPNIVRVHDYGTEDGQSYLVMEHVEGRSLRHLMRERIPAAQALDVARQVAAALEVAHGRGVVHRDVKPENILVDAQGRAKLVDFGLARLPGDAERRLTRPAQVMGTLHYMAPEQYENPRAADHRTDVYSLGVVLYELLTGELPLGRFPPPSRKAEIDPALDRVVLRALEKEPDRRYPRIADFRADLARAAGPRRLTRRWALAAGAALAAGIVLAVIASLPGDPRDAFVGSWKGMWSSAVNSDARGRLETVISKSPDDPKTVHISFRLIGSGVLPGEGDFEVRPEGGASTLTARRLTVAGLPVEGRWRFTFTRSGPRATGTYEIIFAGLSDRGYLEQEPAR
jgi:serine/threonine protein kinase